MSLIKITDDNNKKTTCQLQGYSISPYEEGLLLEISTPNFSLKYLLHPDRRENNINKMETYITSLFDDALQNNKTVYLEEYLVRNYIFIGDGKELRKQFTGNKI